MDPRNFSVKPCPSAYAAKSNADISSAGANRKDFFNSLGKIGDIEVLNSVGAGGLGEGLRTLAGISNSIRTGCGSLPSVIGDSLDQGANWVLSLMGFAPAVIESLRAFQPGIANQAWGQAQQIYQHIQSGTFKITDIPSYLQDFQNLERLARGIFTSGDDRLNGLSSTCEASPYAVDLIARAPKYKFMFLVQFVTAPGYNTLDPILRGMAFVVKKSTRPHITFHTEDVNYYNHRTKLITKTEYGDMSMTFHDDITNNTTRVYSAYLKAMSPTSNLTPGIVPSSESLEQMGMSFDGSTLQMGEAQIEHSIPSNTYAGSIGLLSNDNKQQIFKKIILYHVFDNGNTVTAYQFINPRITELIPDDVDMSIGSEGNEMTLTFTYDYVYVEADLPISALNQTFESAQSNANYVLHNNPTSSSVGPNRNPAVVNPYGQPIGGNKSCDPMNPLDTSGGGTPDVFNILNTLI